MDFSPETPIITPAVISGTAILFVGSECWDAAKIFWEGPDAFFAWKHPQYPFCTEYRKYYVPPGIHQNHSYSNKCELFNYEIVPKRLDFSFGGGVSAYRNDGNVETQQVYSPGGVLDGKLPAPYVMGFLGVEDLTTVDEAVLKCIEPFKSINHTCSSDNVYIVDPQRKLDKNDSRFKGMLIQTSEEFKLTGLFTIGKGWIEVSNKIFPREYKISENWGFSPSRYAIIPATPECVPLVAEAEMAIRKDKNIFKGETIYKGLGSVFFRADEREFILSLSQTEEQRLEAISDFRGTNSYFKCDKIIFIGRDERDRPKDNSDKQVFVCDAASFWRECGIGHSLDAVLEIMSRSIFANASRNSNILKSILGDQMMGMIKRDRVLPSYRLDEVVKMVLGRPKDLYLEDLGPVTPTEEPATPVEEPVTPAEEPATPAEEPATPAEEPATPAEEPATPAEEPATPTEEPATPAEEPATPTEEPATPTEEPATPAEEFVLPACTEPTIEKVVVDETPQEGLLIEDPAKILDNAPNEHQICVDIIHAFIEDKPKTASKRRRSQKTSPPISGTCYNLRPRKTVKYA